MFFCDLALQPDHAYAECRPGAQCSVLFFSVTLKVYLFSNGGKHYFDKMCHFCRPKMGHLREKCAFVVSLEGIFGF